MKLAKFVVQAGFLVGLLSSSTAWASKARLRALGQSENGSLFIEDNRNIFLNPATIKNLKNAAYIELGEHAAGGSPKAEGGLVYELEKLTIGAQLGRVSDSVTAIQAETARTGVDFLPQNAFELFVGGGSEVSWGGAVYYANSSSDRGSDTFFPDQEASALSLRGGLSSNRWQAFLNADIRHEAEIRNQVSNQEYNGNLSLDVGGSYSFSEVFAVGATITRRDVDFDNAGNQGDIETTRYLVEAFHFFKKTEKLQVFASAGLSSSQVKTDFRATGLIGQERSSLTLPVTIGFESAVKDWLAIRGSVRQGVLIGSRKLTDGTTDVDQRNTVVSATNPGDAGIVASAGASLMFEGLQLDGVLEGAENRSGSVNSDNLLGRVSLAYFF